MTFNLKQKSIVFVAISVSFLLTAYILLSRYYLEENSYRILEDRLKASQTAAARLDDFFARGTAKLDVIAQLPLLLNGLNALTRQKSGTESPPAQDTLHYLVYKSDIFTDGVYLLNDRGQIIWSEPRDQTVIGTEFSPFEQVRESFKAEHPDTTFTVWAGPKGKNDILLSSTLVDLEGQLEGYLIGVVPCDHPTIVSTLDVLPHKSARMQLVTNSGLVIASTDPERTLRQVPFPEAAVQEIVRGTGGVINPNSSFKSVIAYKPLDRTPFFVAIDESDTSVFRDVQNWKSILTGVGILSMTLVMATLFFVVRSFTKPVELLTEEARRIGAGNMESSFTTDRSDELGVLATTLEDMKTRLKSSYDRLLQSEKMALMGQVVAGIAHELNNPLTIVIGHTELMMMKGISSDEQDQLKRIHDGAERASKIVRNLLTFARQKKPERKVSNINVILTRTIDLRAYELKVSNIELHTELSQNLPPTLCDPHQLQQVFLNLIVNAEQAMLEANGNGRLTIRSRNIGQVVQVFVVDNGPGIPAENVRRVFDPFFTTKPVGKGTGLGLSICQGIIAEHGGRLTVESTTGRGASFMVELPVAAASIPDLQTTTPVVPEETIRPRKILVIDDEPNMRDLFTEILTADGHHVVSANSGKEGLDKIKHDRFDMLITDIKMPDGDGQSLYEAIQHQKISFSTRVLFVTGDLMNPTTLRFLENSGCPWLAKPFEVNVIRGTVREILNS